MTDLLTNAQMRDADASAIRNGTAGETLMKRASEALAEEAEISVAETGMSDICVVCGRGNNAGDGYACAEILRKKYNVKIYETGGTLSPDAARERGRYGGKYTSEIKGGIIIDCIFGTGLNSAVTGQLRDAVERINASGAYVIACDIPSGLNGDNGKIEGAAVRADKTVSIGGLKTGYYFNDGMDVCGRIVQKDIGIEHTDRAAYLYEEADAVACFPKRARNSHKGTYGTACIWAGQKYPGARVMAISAALRTGCGIVKAVVPDSDVGVSAARLPQAVYSPDPDLHADCIAFGMGSGDTDETRACLEMLLTEYVGKLVIDADGIKAFSRIGRDVIAGAKCDILLTPHAGEFAQLTGCTPGEVLGNPLNLSGFFSSYGNVSLLLKTGSAVYSDGRTRTVTATGNSALAKGGSGDMLAGFICGSAARGLTLKDAALSSHFVMGRAAEKASQNIGEYCVCAEDILSYIPAALGEIIN